jgi:hypothetical protein
LLQQAFQRKRTPLWHKIAGFLSVALQLANDKAKEIGWLGQSEAG